MQLEKSKSRELCVWAIGLFQRQYEADRQKDTRAKLWICFVPDCAISLLAPTLSFLFRFPSNSKQHGKSRG